MMLPPFAVERPNTVEDAASLLSEDSVAYCGGTELLLAMKMGLLRPTCLVDLKGVAQLNEIRYHEDRLVIGAAVRHDAIRTNERLGRTVPLLAYVEGRVGNARVRAQGSIGGNICFAEPRSDVIPTLVALRATVTLVSAHGCREMAVEDFICGPYWTARADNELMVDIQVPRPSRAGVYVKFQTSERPVVGVAAVALEPPGVVRIVVGAVTERPMVIEGKAADLDVPSLVETWDITADSAGSQTYKRHITAVYIRKALTALAEEGSR